MPLRLETGITLKPQKPAPPIVHDIAADGVGDPSLLDVTTGPQDSLGPVSLPVDAVFQEGALWCWAACIAMVLAYYQKPKSQCEIVLEKFQIDCGKHYDLKTEGCDVRQVKQTWKNRGFQSAKAHSKVQGSNQPPITLDLVKQQLAAGMPIEAGIVWAPLGGGHAVLIKGWSATAPESLVVNDPLQLTPLGFAVPEGRITYEELADAHDNGIWAYAWTNLGELEN